MSQPPPPTYYICKECREWFIDSELNIQRCPLCFRELNPETTCKCPKCGGKIEEYSFGKGVI